MALEADWTVTLCVGSTSVGQGIETILLQIAADALEMPIDRIRMFHGSTIYVNDGYGFYHSRSTVMGGSAILLAARRLREKMRAAAALRLNCSEAYAILADGRATGSARVGELRRSGSR